jgi:hypothetical protein
MPCPLDVDRGLKRDILDLPHGIRQEIGNDLVALQTDPLPADRQDLTPGAYFHQLPCGYFVSWELIGEQEDILNLFSGELCHNLTIRILGVGADSPK